MKLGEHRRFRLLAYVGNGKVISCGDFGTGGYATFQAIWERTPIEQRHIVLEDCQGQIRVTHLNDALSDEHNTIHMGKYTVYTDLDQAVAATMMRLMAQTWADPRARDQWLVKQIGCD